MEINTEKNLIGPEKIELRFVRTRTSWQCEQANKFAETDHKTTDAVLRYRITSNVKKVQQMSRIGFCHARSGVYLNFGFFFKAQGTHRICGWNRGWWCWSCLLSIGLYNHMQILVVGNILGRVASQKVCDITRDWKNLEFMSFSPWKNKEIVEHHSMQGNSISTWFYESINTVWDWSI